MKDATGQVLAYVYGTQCPDIRAELFVMSVLIQILVPQSAPLAGERVRLLAKSALPLFHIDV